MTLRPPPVLQIWHMWPVLAWGLIIIDSPPPPRAADLAHVAVPCLGPDRHHDSPPPPVLQIWLTWPFLAWGLIVVMMNAMGHNLLASIPGPIATFNIVNFVTVIYARNVYYLLVCRAA